MDVTRGLKKLAYNLLYKKVKEKNRRRAYARWNMIEKLESRGYKVFETWASQDAQEKEAAEAAAIAAAKSGEKVCLAYSWSGGMELAGYDGKRVWTRGDYPPQCFVVALRPPIDKIPARLSR